MADRAIHVAVLEGYFASLTTLGLPMPLSLQLQQSNLRLEKAMWTARSTRTGFSVSLFWPFADSSQTELKQKMKKRRRRNRRKAKATTNLNNNNLAPSTPGSCVSIPINANFWPAASQVTSATATNSLSLQSERGTDHSVSQEHDDDHSVSQECGDDTPPNSTLSQESQNVEPTIDLNECSEIHYHQDGDMHGVKYVCEGREGWTPVVGKRRKYRVPTRLLRLRAPPHVRATLPSSGSDSDSDSGSDCSLHIPPDADVQYSVVVNLV